MKFSMICLAFTYACNPFNFYPDSVFEEKIEKKIMEETGIYVDLSGDTPETKLEAGVAVPF